MIRHIPSRDVDSSDRMRHREPLKHRNSVSDSISRVEHDTCRPAGGVAAVSERVSNQVAASGREGEWRTVRESPGPKCTSPGR